MFNSRIIPTKIGNLYTANVIGNESQRIRELEVRCKELEAALALANNSLGSYVDYAFIGIIDTDDAFLILRANQAALSILGDNPRDFMGMPLSQVLPTNLPSVIEHHLFLLREQGVAYTEISLARLQGNEQIILLNSIQNDEHHYIHFFDDVTEQRQASAAIKQALFAAEVSERAKSVFLTNISHEIRTPLNGIIGLSKLAETANAAQRSDYLRKIHESGQMLLSIVNELLDYAKIEAGAMDFERNPLTLDDLLNDVSALLGFRPQFSTLDFAIIPDPIVPDQLVGDRMRTAQCLVNLLNNALKFTSRGYVYLKISLDEDVNGFACVRFSVEDSGIGISPEVLSNLFVPFVQADLSTARRFGGTGLGLALVKQMVSGMGGDLRAESTPGVGSCFSISLPMLAPSTHAIVNRKKEPDSLQASQVGKALVIYKQPGTRRAITAMLQRCGWEVRCFSGVPDDLRCDLLVTEASPATINVLHNAYPEFPPTLVAAGEYLTELPDGCRYLSIPVLPILLRKALNSLFHGESETATEDFAVPTEFSGVHLLVVEDNPVNQKLILGLLEQAGIHVSLAQNGREALSLMQSLPQKPAMILMDIQMPEMDGLEATSRLRADGFGLPIIALSAGISYAERSSCELAGFSDFIPKPIDFDELWGVMTRWLPPQSNSTEPSVSKAKASVENAVDFLKPVIDVFIRHHATTAQRMTEMLRQGDLPSIGHIVHQVKGIAPQIAAQQITQICMEIEVALAANAVEVLSKLIDDFAVAYADFVKHQLS